MPNSSNANCPGQAGASRRTFLRAGFLGLTGLSLADVLRARAARTAIGRPGKDTSVILVWLGGGASHIDMWDMKPDAPAEVRGEFHPIASSLTGVRVCEHLPLSAQHMHQCSLLRSVTHADADHATASHYLLTGHEPTSGQVANEVPSFGSIVAKERGPRRPGMPAYVAVPEAPRNGMAAYLGMGYNPFSVGGDPGLEHYSVQNLTLPDDVSPGRIEDRRQLLGQIDSLKRERDRSPLIGGQDAFSQKAFEMVTGPAVQAAFDLKREDDRLRDRYGRTTLGQSMLMARRLVEAGVTFVTVKNHKDWDTHQDNFNTLKNKKLPELDRPWAALLQDLNERGLTKDVLVILLTEFGRSWYISGNGGREHWPQCNSVLVAGGGLRMGQVIGSSDAKAAFPKERPLSPEDLIATLYHVVGIDPETSYLNEAGRPIKFLSTGKPIRELIG